MASLKEVKGRINSVKKTRKITSAMRMVASAKLHKAQNAIENMLPYQYKMNNILTKFLSSAEITVDSPLIEKRDVKRIAILAFSSNSSLCGAFNANVIRTLHQTIEEYHSQGFEEIRVYPIGRKIEESCSKFNYHIEGNYQEMAEKPHYPDAAVLAEELMQLYVDKKIDKVELLFHHFKSVGSQQLIKEQLLPIDINHLEEDIDSEDIRTEKKKHIEYIVEPSEEEFIADLLPQVLRLKVYTALLDSNASEHAARTIAMQTATDNANELIQDLTQQYNKTRQQTITNELLDIVSGSIR